MKIDPKIINKYARKKASKRIDNLRNYAREPMSEKAVIDIRARRENGEKLESIAQDYGVTAACICQIARRSRRGDVL